MPEESGSIINLILQVFKLKIYCNPVLGPEQRLKSTNMEQKGMHTQHAGQMCGLRCSMQFSLVVHLCLTLCDPMDCSTPGFPVQHQLPELAQTHIHRAGDAIQPSHSLSSPSSPALNLCQHQVFSNESALRIRWPKYWSFSFNISPSNEHPGLISFRMDWLDLLEVQGKT